MRKCRLIETRRCYHLISRLAHRAFFLTDEEKTRAVALMRRVEDFCGVIVLAYAFMSNHFHIFIYVPEVEAIGDEEILRRINVLYRSASLGMVLSEWKRLQAEEAQELASGMTGNGHFSRFSAFKASFLKRMWNSAEFMRTFKQHFTMSYNGRRDHRGTMWEGRYHERNHRPDGPVMWKTAAYIDVNAVTSGMVPRPEDYEWCSFAAAERGDVLARRGYAFMYGEAPWEVLRDKHQNSISEALAEIRVREAESECCSERMGHTVSRVNPGLAEPRAHVCQLERGDAAVADHILQLLGSGPMRPSALRKAVGITNRNHFNSYYMVPLLAKGIIERTKPDHPQSPQQMYRMVK